MCKLRRKLLLFDYTVGKLVEWETKSDLDILSIENINESLSKFTSVGFMKLLYFICLQSVNEKNILIKRKQENGIEINDDDKLDLFKLFDNFVALPKGPAEDDVYSHRSTLLSYRYVDAIKRLQVTTEYIDSFKFSYPDVKPQEYEGKNFLNISNILKKQLEEADKRKKSDEIPLSKFLEIVDKAIEKLKVVFAEKKISLLDFSLLVELTHKLPLWNYYISCENNNYSPTEEELNKEAACFLSM